MPFAPVFIERYENTGAEPAFPYPNMKVCANARIIRSTVLGPFYINRNTQVGPDAVAGKYLGMNADCFVARAEIGAFCSFGARTSINPFNHPTDWLSINEFQYHPNSFDWVDEYNDFVRLERTPDMLVRTRVGNDVWSGHNVNVLAGVSIGDGAVLGAGAVVTRDVPPYAVVGGAPAQVIRYRFPEAIVERLLAVRWWDFELPQLSGLDFRNVENCLPRLEEMRARADEAER